MALILDTESLDPADRAVAVGDAMQRSGIPARITHEPPPERIYARIHLWSLGGGTTFMHRDGSGVCLTRTSRQVRAVAPERISVTVLGPGRWTYTQGRGDRQVESDVPQVLLTDQAAPYEFNRIGAGHTYALSIDHAALGLPIDQVRAAAPRIESSPIYGLVCNHLLQLRIALDAIPAGPALFMVGNAATELVRALISSANQDSDRQHAVMTDSLPFRLALYLEAHLRDLDLTPHRIANDHHVSVRQLYNVWSRVNDQTLVQWIVSRRLDAARRALAGPDAGSRTISAVAHQCGFADTAHFSRRFRAAYGMSPREWRAVARFDT